MSYLPKQLQKEEFHYSSTKTTSDLVAEIQNSLSGKFISDNEFYVTSEKSMFFSDSGSSGHNSLKGKITSKNNKSVIDVVVNPIPRIKIEVFAPPIFGLVFLYTFIFQAGPLQLSTFLYAFTLIILIPLVTLYRGQIFKDKLRKTFVQTLNLSEI